MKTTITIEIETPDNYELYDDTPEELGKLNKEYSVDGLHRELKEYLENNLVGFVWQFLENAYDTGYLFSDYLHEGDTLAHYNMKIKIIDPKTEEENANYMQKAIEEK